MTEDIDMGFKWVSGSRLRIIDKDGDCVDFSFYANDMVIESEQGDEALLTREDAVYLAREILKHAGIPEDQEFSLKEDDIVPLECMLMDAIAEEFDKRPDNGSTEWDCQKVAMSNRISELLWSLHNGN